MRDLSTLTDLQRTILARIEQRESVQRMIERAEYINSSAWCWPEADIKRCICCGAVAATGAPPPCGH